MVIQVDVGSFLEVPDALLTRALTAVIGHDGREHTEISLALVDDARIRELNRVYLDCEGTTDVIAFALGDEEAPLGDVYVCVDQARRQAEEFGVSLMEELLRLAIHGALHVLGHDHPKGDERARSPMFVLQERLLADVLAAGE